MGSCRETQRIASAVFDGDSRVRGHILVGPFCCKIRGLGDRRHHVKDHDCDYDPKNNDKHEDHNFCYYFTNSIITGSHNLLNTHQQTII
jgi:hypothetical protein